MHDVRLRRIIIFSTVAAVFCAAIILLFQRIMLPFCLALFFSYLLMPAVNRLEARLRIPRVYCVTLVLLIVFLVLGLILLGLVPIVKNQIISLYRMVPLAKSYLIEDLLPLIKNLMTRFGLTNFADVNHFIATLDLSAAQLQGPAADAIQHLWSRTSGVVGSMVDVLLVPFICFFLLNDIRGIRAGIIQLVPADMRPGAIELKDRIDATLKSVLKGQVVVAAILALLYMSGFSAVGLHYGITIGAIAGICRLVPYLDVLVGVALTALVIITDPGTLSWSVPIGVAIVFIVVQLLDGMIITPRIIGDKAGLHPAVVIASVLAFGYWFGFLGVLVAIPVVAVAKVVLNAAADTYTASEFYQG